jgi:hypothetical protein
LDSDHSPDITGKSRIALETRTDNQSPPAFPPFKEAVRYWLKLGCISFGGPAGQIAIMHRELVEKRRWNSDGHLSVSFR